MVHPQFWWWNSCVKHLQNHLLTSRILMVIPPFLVAFPWPCPVPGCKNQRTRTASNNYIQWLKRYGEGRKDKGDGGGSIVVKKCMLKCYVWKSCVCVWKSCVQELTKVRVKKVLQVEGMCVKERTLRSRAVGGRVVCERYMRKRCECVWTHK